MRGDPAVTGRGRGSTKRSERSGRRRGWEREASKALAEGSHVEVHQQPRADGRQLHVGQDLRRVHRKQPLDRLELHEDLAFDNDVDAIAAIDDQALVADPYWALPLECQAAKP